MIHKIWKKFGITDLHVLDVFKTLILQLSYDKNNF